MADPLEIELQKIIESLSGEAGVVPPPGTKDQLKWYLDYIVTILTEGGGGSGGAVVPDDYFFTDAAARDAYFSAHPDELKDDVLCCTNTPVALWKWNGTEWKDSSTWVRGPKGDNVELRIDSGYIQWKETSGTLWHDLIPVSELKGNPGDSVNLRVDGGYIQWKHTSDTQWQNIIALSAITGTDGITPHIDTTSKHWFIGEQDTGILAEGIPVIWKGDIATAPDNPQTNWAYYDTTLKQSRIYDGTQWGVMTKDGVTPPDAPSDGSTYGRKDGAWEKLTGSALGLETVSNAGDNSSLATTNKTTKVAAINEVLNIASDAAQDAGAAQTDITNHKGDTDNPHDVTAEQLGLGNVDNTADADKPVSAAQQSAIDGAVAAEAEARDAAIAAAQLDTQKWLSAVDTKAELPDPTSLERTVTYLCRVMRDPLTDNNGVWQLIAGADAWTYFSDNLDFIDETELTAAVGVETTAREAAVQTLQGAIAAKYTKPADGIPDADLKNEKVNVQQNVTDAGKAMVIGDNGRLAPGLTALLADDAATDDAIGERQVDGTDTPAAVTWPPELKAKLTTWIQSLFDNIRYLAVQSPVVGPVMIVGRWHDGKPIYRRVFNFSRPAGYVVPNGHSVFGQIYPSPVWYPGTYIRADMCVDGKFLIGGQGYPRPYQNPPMNFLLSVAFSNYTSIRVDAVATDGAQTLTADMTVAVTLEYTLRDD